MTYRKSTFKDATMAPPYRYWTDPKRDRYTTPCGPMRAHLMWTKGHPTARDGSESVLTDAIINAEFDLDGNVISLTTQTDIFVKETSE